MRLLLDVVVIVSFYSNNINIPSTIAGIISSYLGLY